MTRYIIRFTTGEQVQYLRVPSKSAKVRSFRTDDPAKATRYRREEAYTIQTSAATMNPDAVVEFIEEPRK
jgi:hypothetical protein